MNKEKIEQDDCCDTDNRTMCDPASRAQIYIGTKQVKAFPMHIKDAERRLNRRLTPVKESYSGDGYIVVYSDDYQSWSPKEVFDEAYRKCETYIDRLIIEKDDLEARVLKLRLFVEDNKRERLAKRAETHLEMQLKAMSEYLSILNERIDPSEGCEGNTCCGSDKCQDPS